MPGTDDFGDFGDFHAPPTEPATTAANYGFAGFVAAVTPTSALPALADGLAKASTPVAPPADTSGWDDFDAFVSSDAVDAPTTNGAALFDKDWATAAAPDTTPSPPAASTTVGTAGIEMASVLLDNADFGKYTASGNLAAASTDDGKGVTDDDFGTFAVSTILATASTDDGTGPAVDDFVTLTGSGNLGAASAVEDGDSFGTFTAPLASASEPPATPPVEESVQDARAASSPEHVKAASVSTAAAEDTDGFGVSSSPVEPSESADVPVDPPKESDAAGNVAVAMAPITDTAATVLEAGVFAAVAERLTTSLVEEAVSASVQPPEPVGAVAAARHVQEDDFGEFGVPSAADGEEVNDIASKQPESAPAPQAVVADDFGDFGVPSAAGSSDAGVTTAEMSASTSAPHEVADHFGDFGVPSAADSGDATAVVLAPAPELLADVDYGDFGAPTATPTADATATDAVAETHALASHSDARLPSAASSDMTAAARAPEVDDFGGFGTSKGAPALKGPDDTAATAIAASETKDDAFSDLGGFATSTGTKAPHQTGDNDDDFGDVGSVSVAADASNPADKANDDFGDFGAFPAPSAATGSSDGFGDFGDFDAFPPPAPAGTTSDTDSFGAFPEPANAIASSDDFGDFGDFGAAVAAPAAAASDFGDFGAFPPPAVTSAMAADASAFGEFPTATAAASPALLSATAVGGLRASIWAPLHA